MLEAAKTRANTKELSFVKSDTLHHILKKLENNIEPQPIEPVYA